MFLSLSLQLAFVITGDIHAMWLRDSANQLQSYKPILNTTSHNTNNIASLYRGTINLQARYITKFPYCNAFQPPPDSRLPPNNHKRGLLAKRGDTVDPPYDPNQVWECKYELDSISAFLQLSWDYYDATKDAEFFGKFGWADAVRAILKLATDMMQGTYTEDGHVNKSPYTWLRDANSATETVTNGGAGNPVVGNIGLVRSFFRPSDDSTIYQYFIPANMMFARYLEACVEMMETIDKATASQMRDMARAIEAAVQKYAIVNHPKFGPIFAFEVDGFGSHNFMVRLYKNTQWVTSVLLSKSTPGRRQYPIPPQHPPSRFQTQHRQGIPTHPRLRPLPLKPLLRVWPRPQFHRRPALGPRNGMAHGRHHADHDVGQ